MEITGKIIIPEERHIMAEHNLDTGFTINSALLEKRGDNVREVISRIDKVAFIFITEGSLDISVNLKDYKVAKNDLVTVLRGVIIELHGWSDDVQGYCVNFTGEFIYNFDLWKSSIESVGVIIDNPLLHLNRQENVSFIENCCSMLHMVCSTPDMTFRQDIIKNMLETVIFAVTGYYIDAYGRARNRAEDLLSRRYDILKRFLYFVSRDYETHRDVSYYADIMCITPKHLGYAVKSASGYLASDVISRMVIMDSKSKLKSTDMTVSQIADSLSFPNPSFFCKYFRKHTGMTPKQFRDSEVSIQS